MNSIKPRVLIACTPKSGSTFLVNLLSQALSVPIVSLVPSYGGREQEICNELAKKAPENGFIAQHHVQFNENTEKVIIDNNIKVVLLTRNIFDSLVSLREHLINESTIGPLVHLDNGFLAKSAAEQFNLLSDFAAPWYLNFIASWDKYPSKHTLLYNELFADLETNVHETCDFISSSPTTKDKILNAIKVATNSFNRLNKGTSGRGAVLPEESVDHIHRLAKHFSHKDFKHIGINLQQSYFLKNNQITEEYEINFIKEKLDKLTGEKQQLINKLNEMQSFINKQQAHINKQQAYIDGLQ